MKRCEVVDRRQHRNAREPIERVGAKRIARGERFGERERSTRTGIDAVCGERAIERRRERRRIRIEHGLVDQRFGGGARDFDILGILHDRTERVVEEAALHARGTECVERLRPVERLGDAWRFAEAAFA